MAERLADIEQQIQDVRQLAAVVTAMRGIAASRAQKGRSMLSGIVSYTRVISHAIGQALNLLPSDISTTGPVRHTEAGLILFCAEQGFAGPYSERVFDAANDFQSTTSLLVGTRGALVAKERGLRPTWSISMATHVEAIPSFASRIADALYGYIAAGGITKVDILYSRWVPGSGIRIDRHSLLPIDYGRFARPIENLPPLTTLEPMILLERLVAEYVYAQICEAAMHAFEAENEARMLAMTSAKANIETKLTGLSQRERQLRQEEITTEIIELASGAEALTVDWH
jgi:F-type H+-transporting ATPase subunit gamma